MYVHVHIFARACVRACLQVSSTFVVAVDLKLGPNVKSTDEDASLCPRELVYNMFSVVTCDVELTFPLLVADELVD